MSRPSRAKIVLIGPVFARSGFSRVLTSLGGQLRDRHDVHHLATDYSGDMAEVEEGRWIHPNPEPGDPFGVAALGGLVEHLRPEVVLFVQDPWYLALHREVLQTVGQSAKVVAYVAIDSQHIEHRDLADVGYVDRIIAYSEFGRHVLLDGFAEVSRLNGDTADPRPIDVIPHGVDTATFHPLYGMEKLARARREARHQLCGPDSGLDEAFIVLNANYNQYRKRMDLTIEGFARFAERAGPEVRLWLHTGPSGSGYDVRAMARQCGIEDRLILTDGYDSSPSLTDGELNLLYNACEVGINTSMGEGWGLVSCEHGATGAAQVVPDHSVCAEIWQEAGLLLPIAETLPTETGPERKVVSADAIAAAFYSLYCDPKLLAARSLDAYQLATQPRYSWSSVADSFDEVFSKLLERR